MKPLLLLTFSALLPLALPAADDLLLADFEGKDYGAWKTTGDAFGAGRITIFCDRTGLEVFASDALIYVPMPFQPKADDLTPGVQAKGGGAKISTLQVHELKSAWSPQ